MAHSLNDIIPPSRRRTMSDMSGPQATPPLKPERTTNHGSGFPYGTALVALLVIVGAIAALFYFSGARVEVTPKSYAAQVDSTFSATPSNGDLPYKVISVEKVGSQSVKAETTAQANDIAQGTITIQNAQTVPQTLIVNTRFESPNGLIYKIHAPVTVPAGGSVSAPVFAEKAGAEYNIEPATFTVPGLKGGKAFTLVTGKSSVAMAGGFAGMRPSVSDATRKAQLATIEATLKTEVQAALTKQLPEGYVLVPGGVFTTFTPQSDTAATGTVMVSEKGTATAVVFPNNALAKAIAFKSASTYAGEPVRLADTSGLTLSSSASSTPNGNQTFTFSLTGSASIVWDIDASKIAGAVAGKKRDSAQSILAGFNEIDKAILILRPFFASTYPDDPTKITVVVKAPGKGK